ncbi:GNAT family N-acetyltransferase [Rhodococcus sp. SRB_17]|nr:GNAT family N-acetyltransferase [Rhodococcus sp. SRB_17]
MTESWFEAPTLTGEHVRLEPLGHEHADALVIASDDPSIFQWTAAPIDTRADALAYIDAASENPDRVAFAQVAVKTGAVVGTTSFYQIDPAHRSLAIGSTWLSKAAQGTGINPESKLLLMRRAFDDLGAVRVEWHTDEFNKQSRAAITKLGAQFEGLLRKHRQRLDGSWRTTALFAMTDEDWPAIAPQLERRVRT